MFKWYWFHFKNAFQNSNRWLRYWSVVRIILFHKLVLLVFVLAILGIHLARNYFGI